jgi:hypothetical protein
MQELKKECKDCKTWQCKGCTVVKEDIKEIAKKPIKTGFKYIKFKKY